MPQLASTRQEREEPDASPSGAGTVRDRGDACPGALRLHPADDGHLARIRLPGGLLSAGQAGVLARAAEQLGDGCLDVTSRGNLQLRGLREETGRELAERLAAAGLLPSPRHERVRNIVASPLTGLDGRGHADVRPWAVRLDESLCADEAAAGLSGRFLFAVDDGRGDTAALGADVTLAALPGGRAALLRTGAAADGVRVPAADAPRAALLAAEVFLATARERGEQVWRVGELADGGASLARQVARLGAARGIPARYVGDLPAAPPQPAGAAPQPGVVERLVDDGAEEAGHGEGAAAAHRALYVLPRLGRLTSQQMRLLAQVADGPGGEVPQDGCGLRMTPWRGVVVTGVPVAEAPHRLRQLAGAGLVTGPGSPWAGVSACTGLPGCARSHRDVRADAARHLPGMEGDAAAGTSAALPPVHWSGCGRRCGRPRGDVVDVVAGEGGYTVSVQAEGSTRERAVPDGGLARAVASARSETKVTG